LKAADAQQTTDCRLFYGLE